MPSWMFQSSKLPITRKIKTVEEGTQDPRNGTIILQTILFTPSISVSDNKGKRT